MKPRRASWLLMAPGPLVARLLMVVPCLLVFVLIFFERGIYGGIDWSALTLGQHPPRCSIRSISRSFSTARVIAGSATLIALLIGYPAAYAIAKAPVAGKRRCCSSQSCRSGPIT